MVSYRRKSTRRGGVMKRFETYKAYFAALFLLTVFSILSGCGGSAGGGSWNEPFSVLVSIQVTPPAQSIANGTTQQFMATGIYSDFTKRDLTQSVTWSTAPLASPVATISNAAGTKGVATALAIGTTTITATDSATGKSGTATLTVTAATLSSIGVTPAVASIAFGTTQKFIATGLFSDHTTQDLTTSVTWSSSDTVVATISNAAGLNGLATSKATGGPITITATDPASGKAGTAKLTVTAAVLSSIAVTPATAGIALGTTQQYVATGIFTDLTRQDLTASVTWISSNTGVATISNAIGFNGLATSKATGGPITITATDPTTGKAGTAQLTVTAAVLSSIAVSPASASIGLGTTQQFIATGTYSDTTTQVLTSAVTWSSSDTAVATISNAAGSNGLATSLSIGGPITITATDPATLKAGTAKLTVVAPPILGAAAPFGGFGGGAGMTNQGILTVINGGDIGTTGASTLITGFHDSTGDEYTQTPLNIGDVKGRIYTHAPPPVIYKPGGPYGGNAVTAAIADAAAADALKAFNYLAGLPGGAFAGAGELGGLTLTAGTYTSATTFKLTTGDLTLSGTANDVFVFQVGSGLTVGSPGVPRNVNLIGGVLAKNVYWVVGSAARIEDNCNMVGTIIAKAGVTISTAGQLATTTLNGRALGLNASVTLVNTVINVPAP
jgi:hypothetical protein